MTNQSETFAKLAGYLNRANLTTIPSIVVLEETYQSVWGDTVQFYRSTVGNDKTFVYHFHAKVTDVTNQTYVVLFSVLERPDELCIIVSEDKDSGLCVGGFHQVPAKVMNLLSLMTYKFTQNYLKGIGS